MLGNLQLRAVNDNLAKASLTSRKERIKGWANMKREAWLVFSPANTRAVMAKARQVFAQATARMLKWGNVG